MPYSSHKNASHGVREQVYHTTKHLPILLPPRLAPRRQPLGDIFTLLLMLLAQKPLGELDKSLGELKIRDLIVVDHDQEFVDSDRVASDRFSAAALLGLLASHALAAEGMCDRVDELAVAEELPDTFRYDIAECNGLESFLQDLLERWLRSWCLNALARCIDIEGNDTGGKGLS